MAKVAGLAAALAQQADATALTQTTASLAGKLDTAPFTEANSQRIAVDAQLEASISANAEATTAALAAKQPLVTDSTLTIAQTAGLQDAWSARVTTNTLNNSLGYKQDTISIAYPCRGATFLVSKRL